MFDLIHRNLTRARRPFSDLTHMASLMSRWLPFSRCPAAIGASLQHIGTLPLTAQSSLALVRVYNETLVLGITPQSVTLLTKASAQTSNSVPADSDPVELVERCRASTPTISDWEKGDRK